MSRPKDLIKTKEARLLLGISREKMARLMARGAFRTYDNPLDRRVKLVSRAEVQKLARFKQEKAA